MYSGGEGDDWSWTQTEEEIELKLKVPASVRGRDVKVSFKARSMRISVAGKLVESLDGELQAPVHPEECTWDMEDGTVVLNLLKAEAVTWKRLLVSHEDKRIRRIDGGEEDTDKNAVMDKAKGLVQDMFMRAQADDVYKFEEALHASRADEIEDDAQADRDALEKCRDANSRNSLHFAAHAGSVGVAEYIVNLHPALIDVQDGDGCTALMLSLMKNHGEVARMLLDKGAAVGIASNDGGTALHHAAGAGDDELCKMIVEKGGEVEVTSSAGTPLHWAAGEGAIAALGALLECKADPNTLDGRGIPAIAMAVVRGAKGCTEMLINAGADCKHTLPGNMTPLHVASDMGNLEMVKMLLDADGSVTELLDDNGHSPLSLAIQAGHDEVIELLKPVTSVSSIAENDDTFIAVDEFAGVKQGFAFKMGDKGLGYYKDSEPDTQAELADAVDPETKAAALQLKEKGNQLLKAGDLEPAVEAYSGAIALDGTEHTFFSNRSLVRLKLGDKQGALEDAEKAKQMCPNNIKVHWRLGVALEALDRYVDAASAYYEGLKLDMENQEMKTAFEKAGMIVRYPVASKTMPSKPTTTKPPSGNQVASTVICDVNT